MFDIDAGNYRLQLVSRRAGRFHPLRCGRRLCFSEDERAFVTGGRQEALLVHFMPRDVHLRFAFRTEVEEFLDRQGYKLSGPTMDGFVVAYLGAKAQAAEVLRRNAYNDYEPDPKAGRFGSPDILKNDGKVAAFEMFDAYATEAGLAAKTKRSWKSMLTVLTVFVGHDDLARLTARNMIDWKDHLLKEGPDGVNLHGKTVRNGYLGSVKALLNYAVQQQRLSVNVAQLVTVRVAKKKNQREKGFTHEEATQILTATLAPPPRALSAENAAARRCIPWICAYTDARVNEITQLLPSDLTIVRGHSVLRIDAEASKTSEYRNVPLHEHLIEDGFLEYVASRGKRPLFYEPSRSRGGQDAGLHFRKTGERLAAWIRSEDVGVTDRRVAPNHGWRHRFSSMARHVNMHVDVQNIFQGHSGDKVASDYGDAWIETAYFEIMKIPRYVV